METKEKGQVDILRGWYNKTGELNHAYLLEGVSPELRGDLLHFIEDDLGMRTEGNPDVFQAIFNTFGIDDARDLGERASRSSFRGGRKIFIIEIAFITVQAQNALLKVLEDPTKGTHFFFLMGSVHTLLPTVLSRLMQIRGAVSFVGVENERIRAFLAGTKAERLAFLKNTEEMKEKSAAIAFMNCLERRLYMERPFSSEITGALEEIMLCRAYAYDQSPSIKMLLEHVALTTPTMK